MRIERTEDEIIIKLPATVSTEGVQRLLNFLIYKELTASSQATQAQMDTLAREVNKEWWERNKDRFLGL